MHIFSPNSTLLCWYNLLVVRFPQVVVPPNWARKDFARAVRPFWMMPQDCLFLHRIQFCIECILRISDVSRRSVQSQLLAVRRIEFIGSELRDTQPVTFFSHNSNCSMSTFFSTSRWSCSYHQLVDIGNDSHVCICFQTCNHDTRDDVDNHTTILFILPAIDKEFSALVAGLAFRLFKLLRQSVSFTFGTEEDACSRWEEFLAYLHFIPRCPHGLPWHANAENYKRLFLNKTLLFSAVFILQSFARCKFFSPFSFHYEPLRKLLLGHDTALNFRLGQGILQMHLRVEITRNCHATWVQVQIHKAWLGIDIRLICRLDFSRSYWKAR